jgi:hypothetical protein
MAAKFPTLHEWDQQHAYWLRHAYPIKSRHKANVVGVLLVQALHRRVHIGVLALVAGQRVLRVGSLQNAV